MDNPPIQGRAGCWHVMICAQICVEFWPNVRVHVEEECWDTTKWPGRLSISNVGRIPHRSISGKQTWDEKISSQNCGRHTLSFCWLFFFGGGILISPRSIPPNTQPLVPNFVWVPSGLENLIWLGEKCRMWCSRCSSGRCGVLAMGPLQQGP